MFTQDESLLRLGALALDNLFIQDYLPAAKGDYVKVYLYGLYLSQHPQQEMSLDEMAHDLELDRVQVEAALRYWERRRLVRRLRDNPPEYGFCSPTQVALGGEDAITADPAFIAFSEDVYALFGDQRSVRPSDIDLAWEWVEVIGLPREAVIMLLSHMMHTRGVNFSFKAAQSEAVRMHEEGVASAEDAEAFFAHSRELQEGARAVLRCLGKRRAPSEAEMALYRQWTGEWGYSREAILAACDETTNGEPTFKYLSGILAGIRQRAQQSGAPRTAQDLRGQLAEEQQAHAEALAFARAMGQKSASDLVTRAYRRLRARYDGGVILLAAQETRAAGGDLDKLEQALEALARQGVTDEAGTKAYFEAVHRVNQALQPIMDACGYTGRPTAADRTLYKKWKGMGFSDEMLLLAARHARAAARKMPYIDKVLAAWQAEGVKTPGQAASRPRPAVSGRQVTAQQYTQRDYTEEELERRTVDILEEARKQHE
ncbi:MAG: DnaD domain protein [Clostridia bacterium]|nr:DnaD domain protein [Clostridia bacterium]